MNVLDEMVRQQMPQTFFSARPSNIQVPPSQSFFSARPSMGRPISLGYSPFPMPTPIAPQMPQQMPLMGGLLARARQFGFVPRGQGRLPWDDPGLPFIPNMGRF